MLQRREVPVFFYVIVGVVLLILFFYIGGLFSFPDASFSNVSEHLVEILTHFYDFRRWYNDKTFPVLGIGFIVWVLLIYYFTMYYRNFQEGAHGVEDWADIREINRRHRSKIEQDNMILSQNVAIDTCGSGSLSNNNILLLASSGKGKTTGYIVPNLLRARDHFIVLDVKGDLLFKYGNYLKEKGYALRSLNMKDPSKSDRFNPFSYVENDLDVIRLIENIYESLDPPDAIANDPFWIDGPKLYLQAMFNYEFFTAKEEGRPASLNNILTLCNEQVTPSDRPTKKKGGPPPSVLEVKMNAMRAKHGPQHPAVRDYFKFLGGAEETVKSIVIIVNAKFKLLELPELKRIFEADDMHLQDMAYGVGGSVNKTTAQRAAVFLCADDTDPSLNFVFSMFYTLAVNTLCRIADRDFRQNRGALPIPVGFFMDEFYAGARPDNAPVVLGTIRSRNLYMVTVLQSKAQLMDLYPNDKWKIFLDNCSVLAFYGTSPAADETHEWISKLTGDMTIDTAVAQRDRIDYGQTGGNLIAPAAVKRMDKDDCILFLEGEYPVYDRKERPWENPKSPFHHAEVLNEQSPDKGYVHPVEVIWDEKNHRYITKLDIEVREFADPDNPEFLHADLSDKRRCTIEYALRAMAGAEAPEIPPSPPAPKRNLEGGFIDVWMRYSKDLSDREKQIILRASEHGVSEENLKRMFEMPPDQMQEYADDLCSTKEDV